MMSWQAVFDEFQQKEIKFARLYVGEFGHSHSLHFSHAFSYSIIAKLAGLLDRLESASGAGIPYATEWRLPITGDPVLWYLAQGHGAGHTGDDWNLKTGGDTDLGETVVSVAQGLVVYAGPGRGTWGNLVIVAYREMQGDLTCWRYAHLLDVGVKVGATVRAGQRLGSVGKGGGDAWAAHLHLDARIGGLFDPSE